SNEQGVHGRQRSGFGQRRRHLRQGRAVCTGGGRAADVENRRDYRWRNRRLKQEARSGKRYGPFGASGLEWLLATYFSPRLVSSRSRMYLKTLRAAAGGLFRAASC